MGKTQVLSALALAITIAALSNGAAYAQDEASTTSVATTSAVSEQSSGVSTSEISDLQSQVRAASDKNKTNDEYPGLSRYLDGLLTDRAASDHTNQDYADALSEAAKAANLLAGRDVSDNNSGSKAHTMSSESTSTTIASTDTKVASVAAPVVAASTASVAAPIAASTTMSTRTTKTPATATTSVVTTAEMTEANVAPVVKLATAAVKVVVAAPEAQANEVAENGTSADQNETSPEVIPELPKTGEVKSNLGILITAGVAVAVIVFGATAAILLKGKKRHA